MFRPLDFSKLKASAATVATTATDRARDGRNVASVASVATQDAAVIEKWAWSAAFPGTGGTSEPAPLALSDREPGLAAALDRLHSLTCPKDYSPERWERNRDSALRFASEFGRRSRPPRLVSRRTLRHRRTLRPCRSSRRSLVHRRVDCGRCERRRDHAAHRERGDAAHLSRSLQ